MTDIDGIQNATLSTSAQLMNQTKRGRPAGRAVPSRYMQQMKKYKH